ncbi:MAG TPA: hypothetical protein VKA70_17540 [Blastocatellia bacterium]|nr:hypothetical protein [Blastocatellia bacterium]
MSISENNSSKKKLELLGARYLGEAVVSESEIHDFIRSLQVGDWESFAARMQVIVDATSEPTEQEAGEIDENSLRLIKRVARESKDKSYEQIMGAIIAAIGQGAEGIKSAHKTAAIAVDQVFIWTPDYFYALKQYGNKLRDSRRRAKSKG